jgi:hypothetical protein
MRLHPWHRRIVYAVLAVVALTGLDRLIVWDIMGLEQDNIQRAMLTLHGAFAYLSLMVFGSVVPQHIRLAWVARRNIWSGLTLATLLAIASSSALGIYYGDEELQRWMVVTHIASAIPCCLAFPAHIVIGLRARIGRERRGAVV